MAKTACAVDPDAAEAVAARRALVVRLKRVEGQLRGVQSMIETGDDCEAVAQQLSAARKALDKAFFELLACAIEHPQFSVGRKAGRGAAASEGNDVRVQRIARALAKFA